MLESVACKFLLLLFKIVKAIILNQMFVLNRNITAWLDWLPLFNLFNYLILINYINGLNIKYY
jgi:hypothetical protein